MNNTVKLIFAFIAGVGTGVGGTYVFFKKKSEKFVDEEVKKIKESYDEALQKERIENAVIHVETEEEKPKKPANRKKKVSELREETPEEAAAVDQIIEENNYDYSAISKKKAKTSSKKKKAQVDGPHIITMDEYIEDRAHDKVVLTYLEQEDMFLDDNGEPVTDIDDMVGNECKDIDYSEDKETVYVRNDSIGTDYEIVIDVTHTFRSYLEEYADD